MYGMRPTAICLEVLGQDKLTDVIGKLSSQQIKVVLKDGGIKLKRSGGYTSQARKRQLRVSRILHSLAQGDDDVAGVLLQQWLLNHRREMLVDYLEMLGVKHRDGETDETFLLSRPEQEVRGAATKLAEKYEDAEVRAYLLYVAHQQGSSVFQGSSVSEQERAERNDSQARDTI